MAQKGVPRLSQDVRRTSAGIKRGYIALISAILIAAVLVLFVIAVSAAGFFGRFNIVDSELKEISAGLAEACAQTAILEFSQGTINPRYINVESTGGGCEIYSVTPTGSQVTIEVSASSSVAYTNLEVVINDTGPYGIVSWEEKPSF